MARASRTDASRVRPRRSNVEQDDEPTALDDHETDSPARQLRTLEIVDRFQRAHGAAGSRLGDFEIFREIGRGGMGIVYEARQVALNRQVALKVLPRDLELNPTAVARFEREARAAAGLHHKHIVAVHTFDEQDGHHYYTMDLIEGPPLSRILHELRRGVVSSAVLTSLGIEVESTPGAASAETASVPFVVDSRWCVAAARLVAGVAEALDHAHAHGVIHRDIKPANLLLPSDGRLRITDFGLAHVGSEPGLSVSGSINGTPAYMSPEQFSGRRSEIDHRTDIFSLGAVLYELLTLKRAFQADSPQATIAQILTSQPVPPREVQPEVPAALEEICLTALAKQPAQRFAASGEMAQGLNEAVAPRPDPPDPGPLWPRLLIGALWVVAAALLMVATAWVVRERHVPETRAIPNWTSQRITSDPGWEADPAVSPDGRLVAYSSDRTGDAEIWVADLGGGSSLRLTHHPAADETPAWFPDGSALAFASERGGQWGVWRVPRLGGAPVLLVADAREPDVSPDGTRLAFTQRGENGMQRIAVVSVDDPSSVQVLTAEGYGLWDHTNPTWSPDGRTLVYAGMRDLWTVPVAGGGPRRLTTDRHGADHPAWSGSGRYVYYTSWAGHTQSVWRVPAIGGPAERLSFGSGPESQPSLARDGTLLAYSTAKSNRDIVVLDRLGQHRRQLRQGTTDRFPVLTPDGRAVLFLSWRGGRADLWIQRLADGEPGGEPYRLTDSELIEALPAWSPDDRWIVFSAKKHGQRDLWIVSVEGGPASRLTDRSSIEMHPAWSPDGRRVVFVSKRAGGSHLWVADLTEGPALFGETQITFDETTAFFPAWSPDGKRIAFVRGAGEADEAAVVLPDGSEPPLTLTRDAGVKYVRWLDSSHIVASGRWGSVRTELRAISVVDSSIRALDPPVVLGPGDSTGFFDTTPGAELIVFEFWEKTGDIWVLRAADGSF